MVTADGPNFSYGASIEEHLPGAINEVLEALRQAVAAARCSARRAIAVDLPQLERQYVEELMTEPDAEEGIRAILEKRQPRWSGDQDGK